MLFMNEATTPLVCRVAASSNKRLYWDSGQKSALIREPERSQAIGENNYA